MAKGKLIVIDGIDGSGKATQVRMMKDFLEKNGYDVQTIDFPQYKENFFGKLTGECLSGKYGEFVNLDPHIASIIYAGDRFETKGKIEKWLDEGNIVLCDRYVSANQIHQGGKFEDDEERDVFMKWLDEMEYGVFGLPCPDYVIFLDVPYEVSVRWLKNKNLAIKKTYLKEGEIDMVENNFGYLKNSRESALRLAKENDNWYRIECCTDTDTCLDQNGVHEEVKKIIQKII